MREGIYFAGNAIVEKRGVWYSGEYKRTSAHFLMMIYDGAVIGEKERGNNAGAG